MTVCIYDLRPLKAILADCRDMRRQAREFPACKWIADRRLSTMRYTLAAIRANRAELRREATHAA